MRVLIADDDQLIRKLLQTLLHKLGHEVECAPDGDAALRLLEQPDPPPLTILDWVMPGLSGIEVCKRLRGLKHRPRTYVLLLSSKADKDEVVTGLDAGADDDLVKPFNPMELLARLRVAQRTIAYQQEQQRHIEEMEMLLQRYNLLGEMFGKHGRATDPELVHDRQQDQPIAREVAALLRPARLNPALSRALHEIGLAHAEVVTPPDATPLPPRDDAFTAWSALVMVDDALWLDLLVEADQPSATMLFETLLGRIPVSEREQLDFLAETFNLLCAAVRKSMQEFGTKVLTPVISRSVRSANMRFKLPRAAGSSRHRIQLQDAVLDMTILHRHAPICQKSLGQLNELDLVADNLPSASSTDVFLLNQGVVLNPRYIEKLTALSQSTGKELQVPVIGPSPLAEFFCLGRIPLRPAA
jgi:sigma-B regulation protein RsbU (phosphoserine phosphatase)